MEREIIALPVQLGGLEIIIPIKVSLKQFNASITVIAPLTGLILTQNENYSAEIYCIQETR